jgi:hypothetical protein
VALSLLLSITLPIFLLVIPPSYFSLVQFHLSSYNRLRVIPEASRQNIKKLLRHHRRLKDQEWVPMADDVLSPLIKQGEWLGKGGEGVVFRGV